MVGEGESYGSFGVVGNWLGKDGDMRLESGRIE